MMNQIVVRAHFGEMSTGGRRRVYMQTVSK